MKPIRNILFITLSNIGDAILTTPALEALHQAYPEAVIDIVGDARSEIVFRHCPYRGEIFLKHKREGWRGVLKLLRQLRQKRYDLAVDLRTDGLLWLLRSRHRMGKLANRNSLGLHSVEKHLHAIASLAGNDSPAATSLWLSADERVQAGPLLDAYKGKRILALGPGANWQPKIWPAQDFASLANMMTDRFDAVLLLGSSQDRDKARIVAQQVKLPVIDTCGKTDLLVAGALLASCSAFVGNDSGLGHIASAMGTPTVTVFGPGDPARYRPWGKRTAWLQSESRDIADVRPESVCEQLIKLIDEPTA